jgi:hypothetical protein
MIVPVTPKEVTRRYSDFSVRGALRVTNELVAVWLGFSGFSDTDVIAILNDLKTEQVCKKLNKLVLMQFFGQRSHTYLTWRTQKTDNVFRA